MNSGWRDARRSGVLIQWRGLLFAAGCLFLILDRWDERTIAVCAASAIDRANWICGGDVSCLGVPGPLVRRFEHTISQDHGGFELLLVPGAPMLRGALRSCVQP